MTEFRNQPNFDGTAASLAKSTARHRSDRTLRWNVFVWMYDRLAYLAVNREKIYRNPIRLLGPVWLVCVLLGFATLILVPEDGPWKVVWARMIVYFSALPLGFAVTMPLLVRRYGLYRRVDEESPMEAIDGQ
jgi:hypothetical protein